MTLNKQALYMGWQAPKGLLVTMYLSLIMLVGLYVGGAIIFRKKK